MSLSMDFEETEKSVTNADGKVEVTWPVIIIDEVEGHPNFETVCINGANHKIKRATRTTVGPAVIEVLRNAIGTRYVKVEGEDGKTRNTPQEYGTIPWQQVGTETIRVSAKEAELGHHIYFGKG